MKQSSSYSHYLYPRSWRTVLALIAVLGLIGVFGVSSTPTRAAGSLPCDIYASGGTPCVAAHSTVRALFSAYNGNLYQVRRASDSTTLNIGTLSAGGYANAAAQDSFCAGTNCVITILYDQSGHGNNLTQAPAGGAAGGPDNLANANALPLVVAGHHVYGVYVAPGTGYRNDHTSGIATGDNAEGEYAIFDGTHYNAGCCFDYGNAETSNDDTGNGHMEAIYFGNIKVWGYGSGNGPWVMADLENGLFSGVNAGLNSGDQSITSHYVTAMVKGGPNLWAIKAGNAQSGSLTTMYSGARPNVSGYNPMHKEGAIILGIGGDNSKSSAGSFFEGAMTSGYPSNATDNAVQANIVSVGYTPYSFSALAPGTRLSLRATTSCCTGDYIRHDDSDTKVVISSITSSSSATDKADATWIVRAGLANSSCISFESANNSGQYLRHYAFELYLNSNDNSTQFAQDATFCPQPGVNGQGYSFYALMYSDRYIRHYAYTVYAASDGGSNTFDSATLWTSDVTWALASPWA